MELLGRRKATVEDFEFAADRIRMGVGRHKLTVTDKEKLMTAYHEGKSMIIRWSLNNFDTPLL